MESITQTPNPTAGLIAFLPHEDTVFEDQTIYAAGNVYFGCTFHRCTFVLNGLMGGFHNCTLHGCVWHINWLVHDRNQAAEYLKLLEWIIRTLPSYPTQSQATAPMPPPIDLTGSQTAGSSSGQTQTTAKRKIRRTKKKKRNK